MSNGCRVTLKVDTKLATESLRELARRFREHQHGEVRPFFWQRTAAPLDAEQEMRSCNLMTVRALPCDFTN
ncbi:hypothetical protein [Paraburkholderia mimosarum]|uniref:hypothetical protein n=1 Tax=Paraburkholderia mimosarum TaxID=312026 RepID=UPI000487E878|nr:hypothetical protein [Paraburkholderia mimosarum]